MIDLLNSDRQLVQYEALLARSFPVPSGGSFFDDFPVWNPAIPVSNRIIVGVVQDERVVAGASARIATLRCDSGQRPIAIIGGVACDPEYRGQGYASRLVEVLLEWSSQHSVAAELLWSSELSMYERLGFSLSGVQVRYDIQPQRCAPTASGHLHDKWNPQIWNLALSGRTRGLVLGPEDRGWFEAHQGTRWCYLERDKEISAYVAYHRGIDLPNLIHEWAGSVADVQSIFAYLHSLHPQLQVLGSLEDGESLGLQEKISEPLCLMRGGKDLGNYWIWGLDAA